MSVASGDPDQNFQVQTVETLISRKQGEIT